MQIHRTEKGGLSHAARREPVFLAGVAGPLFAIYHPPHAGAADRGDLIYLPPFAEELNRARRMAALQASALAAAGTGVLLLDPHGCGDSAGEFSEARWEIWRQDVRAAGDWLAARGRRRIGLWGLRLGATLAADAAAAEPGRFDRLILWQPVGNGESALTQFLRIRVAAAMAGGAAETTQALRKSLAAGQPVEVAGYTLHPELAAAIDGLRLAPLGPRCQAPISWLELAGDAAAALTPAARRVADEWRAAGVRLAIDTVVGEPFWSTPEITVAPALLAATLRHAAAH
jgi:exosortase A-associated hydrolase 2